MAKEYLEINTFEAAQQRIEYLFNEFENVMVAFSGGKDSSVCLNMCYDYAREHNCLSKLAMYHLDYEAQYQMTTDFVDDTFKKYSNIRRFWLCLPVSANCGCRMDAGTWIPWEKSKEELWVRKMPQYPYVVTIDELEFEMKEGDIDYDVQDTFGKWYASKYGKTAVVIGIRTDESLNRFRAIQSETKRPYKGNKYINGYPDNELTYKAYPIYDWSVEDIWVYNAKFEKDYNKLYDLYYKAGLTIEQMRVANPFHSCGQETLKLYKVIDPNNWGRMVSRVNGVNFTAIYGGTTAMGWKNIKKPGHFTWKEYCYFLLGTLDEKTRNHYIEKLNTSIQFWKERGGCLSDETIQELENEGVTFVDKGMCSNYASTKRVVSFDEYLDDTSVTDFKSIPTYKRMCVCILKNDYFCKYMGFAQTKNEREKRMRTIEKYRNL